ncbi:MAG: hypothetical protein LH481_12060 [Burkholderiales bacterium]|nr:hypothetical protein [Burkholderiales bacterium]
MPLNHYELLDVRPSATDAQIRRAAQMAKDIVATDSKLSPLERESQLAQLQAAEDTLTTPAKRDHYDASLRKASPSSQGENTKSILVSPILWVALFAIAAVGGGLYWQNSREQTRLRVERERVVAEQQAEQRANDVETQRVAEKQRLIGELRAQREADDKQRQTFNEISFADSQKKNYVVDDRYVPPPPTNSYGNNYDAARRSYEDQRQINSETQRRAYEENKQRYEEEANLQRARAEVERQKRYLEQREREDQYARAQREAASRPNRY